MIRFAPLLIIVALICLMGCDRVAKIAADPPRHRLTVISNEQPRRDYTVTVTDERYLSDVARRLGTTVEAIIRDNGLRDSQIRPGQQLKVHVTARGFAAFKRMKIVRVERRLQRIEARRARKAAKVAELAKQKAERRLERRRKRRSRRRKARRRHKRARKRHKR